MDAPKNVNLTINGRPVSVPAGTSVIEAAETAGAFVPRYCYHIDLSIAGVCRMCVVEIEKNPRLQIACNTVCAEGMAVHTDSPKVKEAVKSALELHLINHPLDCPICDKAGECKLQDFYSQFGLYQSRMEYNDKVHKPKVVDIGTIVLDEERCILCTRCVRFTAEVTGTRELGIFNRGDRSELRTYDHAPLRNDYTGNLADICPVGALTAKDFRFAQRVWFLEKTKSVCTMCATGCNTSTPMNPQTKKIYRVEPRRNPEVNKSWMCDKGRWGFHHYDDEKRIRVPRERADGKFVERTWETAFSSLNQAVSKNASKTLLVLSPFMTNEEMWDTVTAFGKWGVSSVSWLVEESVVGDPGTADGILIHKDKTPNARGFLATTQGLSKKVLSTADAIAALQKGTFDTVFAVGLEGHQHPGLEKFMSAVPASVKLIVHATSEVPHWERADWVLPNVSSFEKNGTMVNAKGRMQRILGVLPPQSTARGAHALVFGLERGNDREAIAKNRAETVFESQIAPMFLGQSMSLKKFDAKGVTLQEAKLGK